MLPFCSLHHQAKLSVKVYNSVLQSLVLFFERSGFYRVFPSEASLRRYIKNRYRQRKDKKRYEERKHIMHGHIQTCEQIMGRIDKVLEMEQKGLAGHREVISVIRLSLWFIGKVAKDIKYLDAYNIYGSNCHFKPSGI
jgi:hypothetical protein